MGSTFDYVIVGAGSAGCVLANRLSMHPQNRVLLLEAGPVDRRREIHIPPGFVKLFRTDLDWAYFTEPEPHLHGRRLYWPRGKVLGGSSSMNAQLYVRGHRLDYDRWRDQSNPGWGYEDVLPYFKHSEHQERGASAYHGAEGPLNVADPRDPNPISRAFVEACQELGWQANDDFNGARQEGTGFYQVTQKRGQRHSAAAAFIKPALGRPNLTVRTGAHASRVLLDGKRARGVEYLFRGERCQAWADGEVILSGGAINSPQLLMLSGIGDAPELRKRGVPVALHLPGVGRNLQDHAVASTIFRSRQAVTLDSAETVTNLLRYLVSRRGPLTTTVCESGAFVRTLPGLEQPDLQFHFLPTALVDHGFDQICDRGFNFGPTLLRPRSRGRIRLRSSDPFAAPRIHGNYLAEAEDLRVLMTAVDLCRDIVRQKPFAPYWDAEVLPGPGVQGPREIEAFIRGTLETIYHPVGTCRMGPEDQVEGALPTVVDASLRVHGIDRLRVIDASIMPDIVAGNTNAPTLMIAEKAADLILRPDTRSEPGLAELQDAVA